MQTRATDKRKESRTESISLHTFLTEIVPSLEKIKYQRKKRWTILPTNNKVPSTREFIDFLYKHKNTIHTITVGKEIVNNQEVRWAIDGNNRVNGLKNFTDSPFLVYPEYIQDLEMNIATYFRDKTNLNLFLDAVRKLTLAQLKCINSRNFQKMCENAHPDLYKEIASSQNDIMYHIDDEDNPYSLLVRLRKDNTPDFVNDIKINVNTFTNYSKAELGRVYEEINKYNSDLTEIQILSARLYDVKNFEIKDTELKAKIDSQLCTFYKKMSEDEVLECYKYDPKDLNAFDFLIGFQNCISERCIPFSKINNPKSPTLMFKLYKLLNNIDDTDDNCDMWNSKFSTDNVTTFIKWVNKSVEILNKINKKFNPVELDTVTTTKQANNKCKNIMSSGNNTNGWYVIIAGIIGHLKHDTREEHILDEMYKRIIYHKLTTEITDKETRNEKRSADIMQYSGGGYEALDKAEEYLNDPLNTTNTGRKITREDIRGLLKILVKETQNDIKYQLRPSGGRTNEKRRVRKVHEILLHKAYYYNKMPTKYLTDVVFHMDHSIPFSSEWSESEAVDIDRLGNTLPILKDGNETRGNRHIREAFKKNPEFRILLGKVVPSDEEYDKIVRQHNNKKPTIIDTDLYNRRCEENEEIYIENFISNMLP
jgi:hypothetical protein